MAVLSPVAQQQLEGVVVRARRVAEAGCVGVVGGLGVVDEVVPGHLGGADGVMRLGLRARLGQLGGDVGVLVSECAYEQWHRLLFARFLAENGLLLHPQLRAPVSLEDCDELAAGLGEPDGWAVASRFAAEILPGIFRLDDPCVKLRLAPESRIALEELLAELPVEVFRADDALGWVYQYWQKDKKDEVNSAERKIGGADLGPVTQLFTENYMVRFLLENSLGAWWAGRHPNSPLLDEFEFLRRDVDGAPAAGTFAEWPERVAQVTVMDPCCGSGHFLVEAFGMLWRMRAEEEGIDPVRAQDLVLAENLFGLELDPRCVQIAMFAVALTAWKAGGRWRELPVPQIACSGLPVKAPLDEWTALADGDQRVELALTRLHTLFKDADTLGSLIDPRSATTTAGAQISTDDVDWDQIAPLLEQAANREQPDPATAVLGADAASTAKAADLLSRQYTLIATNVPYLGRGRQSVILQRFLVLRYRAQAGDLATSFAERCREMLLPGGGLSAVVPENPLFISTFVTFRADLLRRTRLHVLVRLGAGAFSQIRGQVVKPALLILTAHGPSPGTAVATLRLDDNFKNRVFALRSMDLTSIAQAEYLASPSFRITFLPLGQGLPLGQFARAFQGVKTGDNDRFLRTMWEIGQVDDYYWLRSQTSPSAGGDYTGRDEVMYCDSPDAPEKASWARVQGLAAWGRPGVAVGTVGELSATIYSGTAFDSSPVVLVPKDQATLLPLWSFVSSGALATAVRALDSKLAVTTATFLEVPFDVDHWRGVAEREFPDGLPEPWSDDPTQWLFEGRVGVSTQPLQVAVARLVGYRWPEQVDDGLDDLVDADGIVCLPSVAGEPDAASRLQVVLGRSFGADWSPARLAALLEEAGSPGKSLDAWLRDEFYKNHCRVFANRPFVWHVWDGRKDGFSALVNYHRLDRPTLEKLTYTYLGQDWLERQKADREAGKPGAEARVAAALELQRKLVLILAGEPPYDIFVRWKSLAEQPIGWDPDLNDGVRLNVRPFVEAGVLRTKFNVHWKKDRGKNPDGSERHNDQHYTNATKHQARETAGTA